MTGTDLTRRAALKTTGAAALGLLGATASAGTAAAASGWFSNVSNYDGVVDKTGKSEVTITVGAKGNQGNFAFGPAAVRVDSGTTVVWKWNGKGGSHNVVAEDGSFESKMTGEAGHTFSQTFEETGVTKYYCMPHKAMGMKGAVLVGDASLGDGSSGASSGSSDSSGETVPASWFSNVSNYDGVVDETGKSEVTITVGAKGNQGNFAFGPAAVRVDPGTTVVWKWNGKGGSHNVVAEDGSFESKMTSEAGHTFSQTFEKAGATAYYCMPHKAMGMKGAVLVGGAASVAQSGSGSGGSDGSSSQGGSGGSDESGSKDATPAKAPTFSPGDDGTMTKAAMVGIAMAILSPLGFMFADSVAGGEER